MSEEELLTTLHFWQDRVAKTQEEINKLIPPKQPEPDKSNTKKVVFIENDIYRALTNISPPLAHIYAQVKIDLQDQDRLSWMGTAHGVREVLTGILHTLAPDEDVKDQSWYEQEPKANRPTHKQKTKYILLKRNAGSKEEEVLNEIVELDILLEKFISNLVRATYSRASDAAHRSKEKKEVERILRYFEAFAHDLLDLE